MKQKKSEHVLGLKEKKKDFRTYKEIELQFTKQLTQIRILTHKVPSKIVTDNILFVLTSILKNSQFMHINNLICNTVSVLFRYAKNKGNVKPVHP